VRVDDEDLETTVVALRELRRSSRHLRNEALYQGDRSWRLRMETLHQQMRFRELAGARRRSTDGR